MMATTSEAARATDEMEPYTTSTGHEITEHYSAIWWEMFHRFDKPLGGDGTAAARVAHIIVAALRKEQGRTA